MKKMIGLMERRPDLSPEKEYKRGEHSKDNDSGKEKRPVAA